MAGGKGGDAGHGRERLGDVERMVVFGGVDISGIGMVLVSYCLWLNPSWLRNGSWSARS